jgi:hypothetical protein
MHLQSPFFQMLPMRQVVRQTTSAGVTGAPAVLVKLLTYLGFRWHPEFTVYEQYHDFHQEKYRADVRIYYSEENSTFLMYTAYGVRVAIDMAVHDAAFACLTCLHGEYRDLDDSSFRYITMASSEGEVGYYTGIYTSPSSELFAT